MPTDKGQIISKGIFDIPEFSQKRFVVVVKTNSFIRFWGEFEDTKSPLDIIWPLVQKICRQGGGGVRKPEKMLTSFMDGRYTITEVLLTSAKHFKITWSIFGPLGENNESFGVLLIYSSTTT